ncbi:TonB-dependent receptor [Ponticaulis sp.]|uniref:TonB-dependent receptor n=1 Tax=Ponticaulis sp. TaxID=2020902 RepID=UPI00262E4B3C|nr:TonB-dependent receptor [Ponticaulis sp.]MDF1679066.1 TonB-dependent receptor [Ponticaulis sp.]
MNTRKLLAGTILGASIFGSTMTFGAVAQEAASEAEASERTMTTVQVTARRREESLQDVPISVSVATAEDLERQGISATTDLTNIVPNLQFATYGTLTGNNSAAQVFIRGIGQTDATPGVDPGVGVYIDEVYMGRSVGGAMDFRDISSTQVLRGPQGTLFGRNTIGGAVLMTTNRPGAGNTVRVGYGEDNLIEGFLAMDLLDTDEVGVRASIGARSRNGYVTRVVDGTDLGDENSLTGQITLDWNPTSDINVLLRADYSEEDENGSPFVFLDINETVAFPMIASAFAGCPGSSFPPPVPVPNVDDPRCANDFQYLGPFQNGGTSEAYSTLENSGLSAVVTYDMNEQWTLKSISSIRNLQWTGARDADNTPLLILATRYASESDQISQEFQAQYSGDRLNGVIGVYYFDETNNDRVVVDLGTPGTSYDTNDIELGTEAFALFTEWTYDLSEQLSITGGLRYTEEEKNIQGTWFNVPVVGSPEPAPPTTLCPVVGAPTPGCLFVTRDVHTETFDSVTGSANVAYRFNDFVMGYASISQGFKSGGFNQRYNALLQASGDPLAFDEETAQSLEIGFKANPSSNLRVNGAVFSNSYEDIQLTYRVGPAPLLFNAGEATINGAELEVYYMPTDQTTVDFSIGLLQAEMDSVAQVPNLGAQTPTATTQVGDRLPRAPESEMHLGVSHVFELPNSFELTPRIDVTYRESIFFDAGNDIGESSLTLVNGSLTLANINQDWRISLRGENLTDELYLVSGTTSASTATGYSEGIYARPRNFSLTFSKDF